MHVLFPLGGGGILPTFPELTENTVVSVIGATASILVAIITTFGLLFFNNSRKARTAAEDAQKTAGLAFKQLQNNGGSTVKDSQDRTELMVRELVKWAKSTDGKLERDHRALSHLNSVQAEQGARLDTHIKQSELIVRGLKKNGQVNGNTEEAQAGSEGVARLPWSAPDGGEHRDRDGS